MACATKDQIVEAVLNAFWSAFHTQAPPAKRAAMIAAYDGRTLATKSDKWWRDRESWAAGAGDGLVGTATLVSHCDGESVTFEIITSTSPRT